MKTVLTYGTFDFFHEGHYRLLERAKEFCGPKGRLYVGVTSENYDRERGKLNVCQSLSVRLQQVQACGLADEVFVEEYEGQKIEDVQRYGVDIFVIGDDWKGKFDYLKEWCEVVYLPRTKGISSTSIRNDEQRLLRGGIVGCGRIANRFMIESRFVSGIIFDSVLNPEKKLALEFAEKHSLKNACDNVEEFLKELDVVYIATPHIYHYQYAKKAILAGKHVLCEKPVTLDLEEARELYALAKEKQVVFQEALKTAFAPGFQRLINLVKCGIIGRVRQVNATFTKLTPDRTLREFDPTQGGGAITELASYVLCPIVKLLGSNVKDFVVHNLNDSNENVETFSTGLLKYDDATAIFTVGLSAKTEGCLTIAGSKGYVYVPSPWWKTEYFEVRNDFGLAIRRVFCAFEGDGLRYELADFVRQIIEKSTQSAWNAMDSITLLNLLLTARTKHL